MNIFELLSGTGFGSCLMIITAAIGFILAYGRNKAGEE